MPKITSIDALIDRIKEAYPDWDKALIRIRELMETGYYAAVYDRLNVINYNRYNYRPTSFSSEQILETLNDDGSVIPDKFAELIELARSDVEKCRTNSELYPLREQLQDDFKDSYEFNWVSEF